MSNRYLEAGKIINTHGIKGEIKIEPWADTPKFLLNFKRFYIDGLSYEIIFSRVHQQFVYALLKGVNSMTDAEKLKDKIIFINREDVQLDDGQYFLNDLIGFSAIDDSDGTVIGKVTDILSLPGGNICEIKGEREILVPLRPEYITGRDMDNETITVHMVDGL